MNKKENKIKKWLLFIGKIVNSSNSQVEICATDGSQGVIRVDRGDFKKKNNKIYIALGCKIKIIKPPKSYPSLKGDFV